MPQANSSNTWNPSGVAIVVAVLGARAGDGTGVGPIMPMGYNASLAAACHAALVTQEALASLTAMVAELPPDDPRHATVYTMAETMTSRWQVQLTKACRIPAMGPVAFQTKAALLQSLVERDRDDQVIGSPAVQLAASLADDLLAYEAWDAGG